MHRQGFKTLAAVAVLVLVMLWVTACGAREGVITEKGHDPAWVQTQQQCVGYSAQGVCTIWMPITTYWPDVWWIRILSDSGETGQWEVSRDEWDRLAIGNRWSKP